jgi:protoheme IX farnesyltransferase
MKSNSLTSEKPTVEPRAHTRVGDVLALAKLRVNALVVATTAGGYYMAGPSVVDLAALAWTCLGTTLVASGAAAINQVHERQTDRLMERTRLRPVADGRMTPAEGWIIAAALSAAGLAMLWFTSTAAAMWVALATLVTYAGLYTPLKRRTSLATMVGAVPGALPPLIGWAAVRGTVAGVEPWSLFLIGFFWQLPHVLAVSWMYREDYARAGIPVLPVVDTHGALTGRQMVLWAAALVPFSQLPFLFGLTGAVYAIGALVLGIAQVVLAVNFLRHRSIANARMLFYASITYLPLLWILMVAARR